MDAVSSDTPHLRNSTAHRCRETCEVTSAVCKLSLGTAAVPTLPMMVIYIIMVTRRFSRDGGWLPASARSGLRGDHDRRQMIGTLFGAAVWLLGMASTHASPGTPTYLDERHRQGVAENSLMMLHCRSGLRRNRSRHDNNDRDCLRGDGLECEARPA